MFFRLEIRAFKNLIQMHTSSLAPQMETSLESKFSAAFEHIPSGGGSKNPMCNGSKSNKSSGPVTTATPSSEPSGEKTVSFRKGNDLESFESLSSLFANGLFTDLVICCHGKMFKCHRVVMAAASLYIRDALSAFYNNSPDNTSGCNSCNTVMLLPTEIKMTDMEAILRFIYDGHVEVKVDSIESFLRSARLLNINGLSNVNIVFNNGNSASSDDSVNDNIELTTSNTSKNNGYVKNTNSLLNGHAGMNSPPPSPPLLNSSLASLKAMTANQHSALTNGNHIGNKFLNGSLNNHMFNHYNKNNHKQRDQSPLRNESSLLGQNITPAHQSSTPKSIYNNGNMLLNNIRFNSANSAPGSGGSVSRRKQKFPTNIPFMQDMLTPSAFLSSWMNINSEEDDEEDLDDNDDEKRLVIKDDSSNDCGSIIGDNVSTTSIDSKQPGPFSVVPSFPPQVPCMIEVEADPTTFPTYSDFSDSSTHSSQQKRRRNINHFKSLVFDGNRGEKKLKLPFPDSLAANATSSNNSIDVSIKPSSPLMHNSTNQQTSPSEIVPKKSNNVRSSSSLTSEKPLFSAYSTVKTAAGANPSASSPSSSSSASGSWVGSKWKCDICNKYYGNKQTLKEHMDYFHSNREEQIYICNICNKEYTWRKSLMKHYRDIHQMRNTPQLAEINRQLAALSSTKMRTGNASGSGTPSGELDSNSLQSFVSITNYSSRKTNTSSHSKGSSDNSEKSNKSESEVENDNTNDDTVPEEEDFGNEDIGMNGSCTTDVDMAEEALIIDDNKSESASSAPEKTSKSNETNRLISEHSPASSMAST